MTVMFVSYESKNCDVEINAHCRLCVSVPVKLGWVSSESYTKKDRFESYITHQSLLFIIFIRLEDCCGVKIVLNSEKLNRKCV